MLNMKLVTIILGNLVKDEKIQNPNRSKAMTADVVCARMYDICDMMGWSATDDDRLNIRETVYEIIKKES